MDIKTILEDSYTEIEKKHARDTKRIGWGRYTDVLYSFTALFAVGVYIYNKGHGYHGDIYKYIKTADGKRQNLWSRSCLLELYDTSPQSKWMTELCKVITPLAEVYDSIGNLFPVYPGGNQFKGTCGCLDMPDIFFLNEQVLKLELYYTSELLCTDPLLDDIINNPLVNDVSELYGLGKENYDKLIKAIVSRINSRQAAIYERLGNTADKGKARRHSV